MNKKIQKLYCYVDESGQDTEGQMFLVALVVTDEIRDSLVEQGLRIEEKSGKRSLKWRKTSLRKKITYITLILSQPVFKDSLFYAYYKNSRDYIEMSVKSVTKVIKYKQTGDYQATIIVDGLRDVEIPRFAKYLRAGGIKVHKIRGGKDESEVLIRLADAIAGFVRDSLEQMPYTKKLQPLLKMHIKEI
jgi:hypothetical protein